MSRNKYGLPINKKDIQAIPTNSPAHVGKLRYAVDFTCDKGTKILAARNGEVVSIKIDSDVGGPNKRYWNQGNRIVIKHDKGEYTAYEHLKYNGAIVEIGDQVKEGEIIGYSGNTGYSFGPHLHFEVFQWTKKNPDTSKDFKTVKVSWKNVVKKSFKK